MTDDPARLSREEFLEAREAGRMFGTVATGPCTMRGPGYRLQGHGLIVDGVTVALFQGDNAELFGDRCAVLLYRHGLTDSPDTIEGV